MSAKRRSWLSRRRHSPAPRDWARHAAADALAGWLCCCVRARRAVYEPRWAPRAAMQRICVGTAMLRDHMPDKYARVLREALDDAQAGLFAARQ